MAASDHVCAICRQQRAAHTHERLPRSRGGPIDEFNCVAICADCHHRVHQHPKWAVEHGWTIPGQMIRGRYRGPDPVYRIYYGGV